MTKQFACSICGEIQQFLFVHGNLWLCKLCEDKCDDVFCSSCLDEQQEHHLMPSYDPDWSRREEAV